MQTSTITINIGPDPDKMPSSITWKATDSSAEVEQKAKAVMLSFWDGADKTALRIDLWTKEMMVDEMADFYYQTFMTMADAFNRATKNEELMTEMKEFAKDFYKKFRESQLKNQ